MGGLPPRQPSYCSSKAGFAVMNSSPMRERQAVHDGSVSWCPPVLLEVLSGKSHDGLSVRALRCALTQALRWARWASQGSPSSPGPPRGLSLQDTPGRGHWPHQAVSASCRATGQLQGAPGTLSPPGGFHGISFSGRNPRRPCCLPGSNPKEGIFAGLRGDVQEEGASLPASDLTALHLSGCVRPETSRMWH